MFGARVAELVDNRDRLNRFGLRSGSGVVAQCPPLPNRDCREASPHSNPDYQMIPRQAEDALCRSYEQLFSRMQETGNLTLPKRWRINGTVDSGCTEACEHTL